MHNYHSVPRSPPLYPFTACGSVWRVESPCSTLIEGGMQESVLSGSSAHNHSCSAFVDAKAWSCLGASVYNSLLHTPALAFSPPPLQWCSLGTGGAEADVSIQWEDSAYTFLLKGNKYFFVLFHAIPVLEILPTWEQCNPYVLILECLIYDCMAWTYVTSVITEDFRLLF